MTFNSTFANPGKPMKRTAMAKPKMGKCKVCRAEFQKRSMGHVACGMECAAIQVERDKAKKARIAAKAERLADKERKEAIEPLEYFIKQAERAFNAFIRWRDRDCGCISCGRTNADVWNAGHFISVGANRTLRFNEDNVHKQCARPCNKDLAGNLLKYRPNLIAKIGLDRVEWLEGWHAPVKMTREKAKEVAAHYRARLRELKKAGE